MAQVDSVELKLTVPHGERRSIVDALETRCGAAPRLLLRHPGARALSRRGERSRPRSPRRLGGQAATRRPRDAGVEPARSQALPRRGRCDAQRVRVLGFLQTDPRAGGLAECGGGQATGLGGPLTEATLAAPRSFPRTAHSRRSHDPRPGSRDEAQGLAEGTPAEVRGRALDVPRRVSPPGAVDQVQAAVVLRHRGRGEEVPFRARVAPRWGCPDQDRLNTGILRLHGAAIRRFESTAAHLGAAV